MLTLVKAIREERECVCLKDEQQEAANQEGCAAQTTECQTFVKEVLSLMEQLITQVVTITKDNLHIIYQVTGLEHFSTSLLGNRELPNRLLPHKLQSVEKMLRLSYSISMLIILIYFMLISQKIQMVSLRLSNSF